MVIDEVHTPDSSRFVIADGFDDAVTEGRKHESLSKEFLRDIMLTRANGDVDRAKELMAEPLDEETVEEALARYQQLRDILKD